MRKVLIPALFICLIHSVIFCQTTITFYLEDLPSETTKNVGIRGSIPPLDWQKSIPLTRNGDGYSIDIDFLPSEQDLEFKFVLFDRLRHSFYS